MSFWNALLAVLFGLWLTGNIQNDSPIISVLSFLGDFAVVFIVLMVVGVVLLQLPKAWRDFRSGRLKFW